jgi:diacylglycerol kinase (ATP)
MLPFRHVAVVFNGSKSRRRLNAFCEQARALLEPDGGRLTVYEAGCSADVTASAKQAVDAGHEVLIAAGGDGTLFHLLRGAAVPACDGRVIAGMLPLGTSNDFARAVGIRNDDSTLACLRIGAVRRVDLISCSYVDTTGEPREDVFCLSAGLGFTAAVARSESSPVMAFLKRQLGNGAFVLSSARQILDFQGARARLQLDEQTLDTTVSLFEVSKVKAIGGMPLTPYARLDSGTLELCLLHETSRWRRLHLLLNLQVSHRHVYWPDVEYISDVFDPAFNRAGAARVRDIRVETDPALPLHLHGELVGMAPARFQVRPERLQVLASPTAPQGSAANR